MKKTIFKKMLCIINYTNQSVAHIDLANTIMQQLAEEKIHISLEEVNEMIQYVEDTDILYKDQSGYDLIPCACVFAKSDHNNISEALAFCECLLKKLDQLDHIRRILHEDPLLNMEKILEPITFDIMRQTIMLKKQRNGYVLNPLLVSDLQEIILEYEQNSVIISSTLSAIYANSLIRHEDETIRYRNEDKDIVPYINYKWLTTIIPRRGIPENRDITKPIQSFYKDTLMHEFHHACPICGIDIPRMLIASHIKPFRDCAHIFEALDHNNGLLLCRNHDYLFDQGYISFNDDGKMLVSEALLGKEFLQERFHVAEPWQLPTEFMSENRKLFLQYHREHIYLDHK